MRWVVLHIVLLCLSFLVFQPSKVAIALQQSLVEPSELKESAQSKELMSPEFKESTQVEEELRLEPIKLSQQAEPTKKASALKGRKQRSSSNSNQEPKRKTERMEQERGKASSHPLSSNRFKVVQDIHNNSSLQSLSTPSNSESSLSLNDENPALMTKPEELEEEGSRGLCDLSGKRALYSETRKLDNALNFSGQIKTLTKDLLNRHLSYMRRKESKSPCPSTCLRSDSYFVSSKIHPKNTEEGSCREAESKESYSFIKHFPFEQNKKSIYQAHEDMVEWILDTFAYPFYSPLAEPSQEFKDHNLSDACPSCSFYFDYNYGYKDNSFILLDITVRCGDKRSFFSGVFEAEFVLWNEWSCQETPERIPQEVARTDKIRTN